MPLGQASTASRNISSAKPRSTIYCFTVAVGQIRSSEKPGLCTGLLRRWARYRRLQQSQADKFRRILGSELVHDFCPVAFERPVTNSHQRGAFLVGIALNNQPQDLPLAGR